MYMPLHGTYICCNKCDFAYLMKILMFSVEVLNVYNSNFFFVTFISDMKLTTQSNSFLYRYHYNVSIFSDFGWGNNTNIDQAERGTFTMYKKSCYYVHFLAQNHLIAKHLMFQELSW